MVIPTASVRQTARIVNQSLKGARSSAKTRSWNFIQRKTYASGGYHGHQKAGGDLPWAITSVAITLPCIWYLWPQSKKSYDHGHGHENRKSHKGDEESSDGADNAANTESTKTKTTEEDRVDKQHETGSVKLDDLDNQEGEQDSPDTSEDESDNILHEKEDGIEAQGTRFKGPTQDTPLGDTRKNIPDPKVANMKRAESDYGNRQGVTEVDDATVQEPGNVKDKASASKAPGSMTTQSKKQEGVSNADTKHSTDIAGDSEKSQKPGGDPETAKSKGTMDPQPQQ